MIGTLDDAARAVRGDLERIGHGTSRYAYIDDDGLVVYKVDIGYCDNEIEWENYNEVSVRHANVKLPEANLIWYGAVPVIAMEYIDGQEMARCWCFDNEPHGSDCLPFEMYDIIRTYIDDINGFNVIYRDGFYFPIDFA